MRMSIMPTQPRAKALAPEPMNLTALALVLETTDPELHTPGQLPGETLAETAARRAAAADIVDDILTELARDEFDGSAA